MAAKSDFPHLDDLFGGYLNQDYQLSGDTLEDVVAAFKADSSPESLVELLAEVVSFKAAYSDRLDEAFADFYGFDFNPALWGHDTNSFFSLLTSVLQK